MTSARRVFTITPPSTHRPFTHLRQSALVTVATIIETLWRWLRPSHLRGRRIDVVWEVGRDPGVVVAKAREPVNLVFHRRGTNPETEVVHFPDLGILATLPPFAQTVVEVGPRDPGRYKFCAPDGDLEGWLVLEP
jgi:hypothetical protein